MDRALDDFESQNGLPIGIPLSVESEAKNILTIEPEMLKRMGAAQCSEAAVVLIQYAFYLQRVANRLQSRIRWAEESVRKTIAPILGEQRGYSFEERRLQAVRQDEAASKADEIRVKAQLKLDRVSYLSTKVESMSRALQNIKR